MTLPKFKITYFTLLSITLCSFSSFICGTTIYENTGKLLVDLIPPTHSHCSIVFILETQVYAIADSLLLTSSHSQAYSSKIVNIFDSHKDQENIANSTDINGPFVRFKIQKRLCKIILALAPQSRFAPGKILYNRLQASRKVIDLIQDYFLIFTIHNNNVLDQVFSEEPRIAQNIKNILAIKFVLNGKKLNTNCYIVCDYCKPSLQILYTAENFRISTRLLERLTNFRGNALRISTIMSTKVLIDIRKDSNGNWNAVRGVSKFAISHLMEKFNFTGVYHPAERGGGPGILLPNGTWLGETGDIYKGRADLGVLIFHTYLRNQYVSFTVPIKYVNVLFVSGEPQRAYSWRSIYWPLAPVVWYWVIGSCVVMFVTLKTLLYLNKTQLPDSNEKILMLLFSSLMAQNGNLPSASIKSSTRIMIAFWLVFVLLIVTAYCSKLVGLLTFPVLETSPKTWEQLSATSSKEYQISLQYNKGAVYTIFKTTTNPTFLKILPRINLEQDVMKCFRRSIESSKYVCICIDLIVDYIVKRNLSDKSGSVPMITAPDKLNFYPMALVVKKDALYLDKFNFVLGSGAAMGLPEKWSRFDDEIIRRERLEWEREKGKSNVVYKESTDTEALKLRNYFGIFYIFIMGMLTAFVAFFVEFKRGRTNSAEVGTGNVYINNSSGFITMNQRGSISKKNLSLPGSLVTACIPTRFIELFNTNEMSLK